MCIQPSLRSPPKIRSSTLVSFYLPIPPSLVHKIIITIPTNTPFLYTSATLHPSNFCAQPSQQSAPKAFSLPQPFSQFRLHQGTRELGSLVRTQAVLISPFLLMDSDNRAHNPWFPIAQVQKIGVLRVVISDEYACNRNGKPSNPPSLIPSTYYYDFHTLLKLIFPWKPVA